MKNYPTRTSPSSKDNNFWLLTEKTQRVFKYLFRLSVTVFGVAFDEIVVESNLNIRGKSPSSRSQRTQLFPVSKSNITKASPSNENIKLANV